MAVPAHETPIGSVAAVRRAGVRSSSPEPPEQTRSQSWPASPEGTKRPVQPTAEAYTVEVSKIMTLRTHVPLTGPDFEVDLLRAIQADLAAR